MRKQMSKNDCGSNEKGARLDDVIYDEHSAALSGALKNYLSKTASDLTCLLYETFLFSSATLD